MAQDQTPAPRPRSATAATADAAPAAAHSRAAWLMIAAVPLASMLSFAVQPMMGKRLLPIYGGSAGTWLGAMVFFQFALLVGYGWATWLLTRPSGFQRVATLVLAGVAVVSFHLPGLDGTAAGGIGRIVWILSLSALPAMMLLFSVAPLMHGWLRRQGDDVPYYIYAVSNAGSLVGVLAYPILIEPRLGISMQRWIVHGGIVLVGLLLAGAVALTRGARQPAGANADPESGRAKEPVAPARLLTWAGLSAVTCICMLGATDHLAAELGSNPLAWVGPFGVYLLSFTLTFSGRWRPWMTTLAVFSLVMGLMSFMFYKGATSEPLAGSGFWALLITVGSASCVGNALLYRSRPASRFDRFYLAIAAGGVLGGLMISLVLPALLSRPLEFILSSGILLVCGVLVTVARSERGAMAVAAGLVIIPLVGIGWRGVLKESPGSTLKHYRNLYGHMFTRTTTANGQSRVEILSESTIHGSQLFVDPISSRRPTLYYSEGTAAGRIILHLRISRPAMRIGVVGLGAGTLAAYGRAGDEITFWDIDPKAIDIAQSEFTYLKDSFAAIKVYQADGRRGLASSKEDFDVIVIDAFSGDSVPAHLVTVEAIRTYLERLEARKGFLLIHTSSRYGRIFPIMASTAAAIGRTAVDVVTEMSVRGQNADWDPGDTQYIVIPPPDMVPLVEQILPATEDNGRIQRFVQRGESVPVPSLVWTDERHAAIQAVDIRQFLFSEGRQP